MSARARGESVPRRVASLTQISFVIQLSGSVSSTGLLELNGYSNCVILAWMTLAEYFKLVRESSSAVSWSRGVELSREGGVLVESTGAEKAVLRVGSSDRLVSATVSLLFEDEDWMCDCRANASPCEHVAAAIIALKRSKERGQPLPTSTLQRAVVGYRFFDKEGALSLDRFIWQEEGEYPLVQSLASHVSGKAPGPAVSATKEDWAIESLVSNNKGRTFSADAIQELLSLLRDHKHVTLETEAVEVGAVRPALVAKLEDVETGVKVSLIEDGDLIKTFNNGAALFSDGLRPLPSLAEFPPNDLLAMKASRGGKVFSQSECASLASDWIPRWRHKFLWQVQSSKLPLVDEELLPRLVFQTSASHETLSVLPLIVYGNPPVARLDGNRLVFMESAKRVPLRQPKAEARLAVQLHSEWGLRPGQRLDFRGEAALRFQNQLQESRYEVWGDGVKRFATAKPLTAKVTFDGDAMRLSFETQDGGATADPARVFQAWREGLSRLPLNDEKGWAPVPTDWLEKYGHRVLALLEGQKQNGKVAHYHKPEVAGLCEEWGVVCPPDFKRLRAQLENFAGIPSAPLPEGFVGKLRSYQSDGVNWLSFLRDSELGALLADDMGLGKSIQAIATLNGRSVIVAPTSVMPNWQRELEKFRPSLRVSWYHGPQRQLDSKSDVVLTTYAILRMDQEKLTAESWSTIVLDEAQMIKNPQSQSAQAAYRLKGKFRLALTGTPIENRPEDLWSLFHFLNPGLLGTQTSFQRAWGNGSEAEVSGLRLKIKPFMLRRLKEEVAPELPPRTEVTLYSDLSASEQLAYEAVRAASQKSALEVLGTSGNVMAALECLLRLRQAACHPALLPGQSATPESSKLRLLREKLQEVIAERHKALVFSQWTSLLDLIEPELQRVGIRFGRIDGNTVNRLGVVDQFQSDSGPSVLLMTLKAGGVGLNLTAADHVFIVDPWWNPAAEDQAADRSHRIGQTRPVFIHRLVSRGTVEEKILLLQESKREAASKLLSGADSAFSLTREDLSSLLE